MPIDANPNVCTYEWTFSVHVPSGTPERPLEHVFDFVEALRNASRTSADLVKRQMQEALDRGPAQEVVKVGPEGSALKGNVEVVIVEATRLREPRMVSMLRAEALQKLQKGLL